MNKKLKKMVSAVSTLFIVSTLMIGCNSSGDSAKDNGKTEKTKLTLWQIQTAEAKNVIHRAVDRFTKENPQYEVEIVDMSNDSYKQKLAMAMSSNQIPDIFIN